MSQCEAIACRVALIDVVRLAHCIGKGTLQMGEGTRFESIPLGLFSIGGLVNIIQNTVTKYHNLWQFLESATLSPGGCGR